MSEIEVGKIVRFNENVRAFCEDLDVEDESVSELMTQTFLVISVFEDDLEAEVMTDTGNLLRLGFHDLECIGNEEV